MFEKLQTIVRGFGDKLKLLPGAKEEEILDVLSYSVWKTRYRILEEIATQRLKVDKDQNEPSQPIKIPIVSRTAVWARLHRLKAKGLLEMKMENELNAGEKVWALKSESPRDDWSVECAKKDGRDPNLRFYRRKGGAQFKKPVEEELPEDYAVDRSIR